jgi:hypothetical protein
MAMYLKNSFLLIFLISGWFAISAQTMSQSKPNYQELKNAFENPDHATWGEVPLWWWEADSLNKERITWQLEKLSAKGVKAVCPIQRSPARSFPESFSKEWWEMVSYVNKECERLGMQLWLYDQVGYGQYGWLEKAAAQVDNTGTSRVEFYSATAKSDEEIRIELAEGKLLDARAFPVVRDTARDDESLDIKEYVRDNILTWNPSSVGEWKVAVSVAVPYRSFYLNDASADVFLQQLYQRIEDVVGQEAMGKSLAGVFQDEHPPTPRDIYTQELADTFQTMFGYDIARAIPALHFDVGNKTPKYRIDFFDAYLAVVEKTYWKKVFDWTADKNILTSHDNWGRNNIYGHSQGYIDYFRTQRWFSAPGFDDWGQHELKNRNYYDTKIAASIARLYNRPRVWNEGFHSSGWGRSTDQTLSWLSASYAFGANLYDEHGLYYSLNASTWEHAAPDPHWNQPYWEYYHEISDWVARASYLISQGKSVVDAAVHYPVVSLLADTEKNEIDYNEYMRLSRIIYDDGIDNDIIDDQSIIEGTVQENRIKIRGNEYQSLVFGAQTTIRLSVLEKAWEFVQNGGVVIFYGQLPTASVENGRQDPQVASLLHKILGTIPDNNNQELVTNYSAHNGFAAFLPDTPALIPSLISSHINRDFIASGGNVFISHRKIGDLNLYLLQNTENNPIQIKVRFRADGVPELWDPFSGEIKELDYFKRNNGYTHTELLLEGNVAHFVMLNPQKQIMKKDERAGNRWNIKEISGLWDFSVIPTRDNRWGDFEWPPANEMLGPEVRRFKYNEEKGGDGIEEGWHLPGLNDLEWEEVTFDQGPYWLAIEDVPVSAEIIPAILEKQQNITAGDSFFLDETPYQWREVSFSQKTGLSTPAPWGGHSGYPDGHYNKNFIQVKEGRKLLFTRIYSPREQRAGLAVMLRNQLPRLWVNGKEENFAGAIGNLPLKEGYNQVLIDLPDGNDGMIYVQKEAPAVAQLENGGIDPGSPGLSDATWIWAGNSEGAYFRKTFNLDKVPETAQVMVTGVSGFRLFINGQKVEEDIGPWATWEYPKIVNIKPWLKRGENLFAVWGQFLKGMNVSYPAKYQGFILAGKVIFDDGRTFNIETDPSWKGNTEEMENWQFAEFDDSGWQQADMKGKAGDDPWGTDFLKNAGSSTTPYRPLSVNLNTPLLEVFDEMPDIIYDVKPISDNYFGWYRFEAPPGLTEITLPKNEAKVWVNGTEVPVNNGLVKLKNPPVGVSIVAIRLNMKRGEYAGAAFEKPVKLKLGSGKIKEGLWQDFALPTYSGIGVYKQTIHFSEEEANRKIVLDLGKVYVACEVFINNKSAGKRVAKPFKFNISDLVNPRENKIEIRVANTLAPHYSFPARALNLGPVESGLAGPVLLRLK